MKVRSRVLLSLLVAFCYLLGCAPWSALRAGLTDEMARAATEHVYRCADHECGCQSAIDCATDCCCYPVQDIEAEESCCDDETPTGPVEVSIASASCSLPPATTAPITLVDRGLAEIFITIAMSPTEGHACPPRPDTKGERHDDVPEKVPIRLRVFV